MTTRILRAIPLCVALLPAGLRAAVGRKLSLLDTDDLWGEGGDYRWIWKSFLRGHQPLYMDRIAEFSHDRRGDIPGAEDTRRAMGAARPCTR